MNVKRSGDSGNTGKIFHPSEFVAALEAAPKEPGHYHEVLRRIYFDAEALAEYCHFDCQHYTRNLIARTDKSELLVLCWEPGQITPIHDHAGSDGWVFCLQGRMEEVQFRCLVSKNGAAHVEKGKVLRATAGEMTYVNDDIAWHTVTNPTSVRAVSLHLYSGPIDSCKYFDPLSRTVKSRRMLYHSVDGLLQ